MASVSAIGQRGEIKPSPVRGVRVVAALLRCTSCKHEWHGELDAFGSVLADTARCPRCAQHSPEPPTAA